MKKVDITKAIAMAKNGESLAGVAIDHLEAVRVRARDVLLLSEFGVVVPEQNIHYDDADVVYDPEFDEVEWTRLPANTSLEEQAKMVADFEKSKQEKRKALSIELDIENQEVSEWASNNYDKIKGLLSKLVTDLYEARTIMEK